MTAQQITSKFLTVGGIFIPFWKEHIFCVKRTHILPYSSTTSTQDVFSRQCNGAILSFFPSFFNNQFLLWCGLLCNCKFNKLLCYLLKIPKGAAENPEKTTASPGVCCRAAMMLFLGGCGDHHINVTLLLPSNCQSWKILVCADLSS